MRALCPPHSRSRISFLRRPVKRCQRCLNIKSIVYRGTPNVYSPLQLARGHDLNILWTVSSVECSLDVSFEFSERVTEIYNARF